MKTETDQAERKLKKTACGIRRNIIKMLTESKSGHTGGSLSAVDILTSLYFYKMRYKPSEPYWTDRDRFVLSKGHAAPALYAVLSEAGYFPKEELATLRKLGSRLQGHPDRRKLPGVEASTGSLGQGISIACGIALCGKHIDKKSYRVYALLGDGENQEGEVWEAAMSAAHYHLDNLCAVLDYNGLQIDGKVLDVMNIDPISDKWRAFGWNVMEADGHSIGELTKVLDEAETVKGRPSIIIAKTIKGKGVSFMEGKVKYHGTAPTYEECEKGLCELDEYEKNINREGA
ncbi:MAG: transketolase [bacterium]